MAIQERKDREQVYRLLIKPPRRFILALRVETDKLDNLLQLMVANDPGGIIADTPLHFTLNNIKHNFNIYELTESLRNGFDAYGSGVRALRSFLGEPPVDLKVRYPAPRDEARKQGERIVREDPKRTIMKVVVASGESQ